MNEKLPDTHRTDDRQTDSSWTAGQQTDIALMSEELHQLLGAPPRRIARFGNMLLLLIVVLLIVLSGFIKYPDVIAGRVLLTPAFQAVTITLPSPATLRSLYVHDGDTVRAGQPLFDNLRSPAAGKVIFLRLMHTGEPIPAATPLLLIVPAQRSYTATVSLPSVGSGKIRLGQPVVITMDDFPSAEFGNLTGRVASLPEYKDNMVVLTVTLDHAAQTTYRKELPIFRPMQGIAEITTAEQRLSKRIFSFLR